MSVSDKTITVIEDKHKNSLYGIGGFLFVFLFFIGFFIPLLRVYQELFANQLVGSQMFLLSMHEAWQDYKLHIFIYSSLMILWQWIVLYNLVYHFKPKSVFYARVFLILTPFVEVLFTYFIINQTLGYFFPALREFHNYFGIFFSQLIWSMIWLSYFCRSKRIKATYFTTYVLPAYDKTDKSLTANHQENLAKNNPVLDDDISQMDAGEQKITTKELFRRSFDTHNPAKPDTDTMSFLLLFSMMIYFIYIVTLL